MISFHQAVHTCEGKNSNNKHLLSWNLAIQTLYCISGENGQQMNKQITIQHQYKNIMQQPVWLFFKKKKKIKMTNFHLLNDKLSMLKVSSGRFQCRQLGFHNFPLEVNLESSSSVSLYVLTAAMTGACLTAAVEEKNL